MTILSRFRLRTKLMFLLGLSALAVIASIALAASKLEQTLLSDRIDKLRAATQMFIGLANTMERRIAAGEMTRSAAIAELAADLRVMHFDNGDGYVVFQSRDGLVIAHGGNPKLDGKPASGKDASGRTTNELALAALQNHDEGVIRYVTPRPGQTVPVPKVAYVAPFGPWQAVAIASAYTDDLDATLHRSLLRLGTAGGVVLFVTVFGAWLVNRDITSSLGALKAAMERLAGGELSVAVPGTNRQDEVGGMAGAVLVFRRHMETAASLAEEKEKNQERADAEKRSALRAMADKIEAQTGAAIDQMHGRTAAVADTAGAMTASATRTGMLANDAAQAAARALATAQTVASAAEELASSIREIGGQVSKSTDVVSQAVAAGAETRTTIEVLNEQVGQIGAVAEIIREIAARTNLLALNATIEAARAGDAGKGFAVVASEVKQLANQTAHATEEIAGRIGEVRAATGASVAAVGRIEQTVTAINAIASSIAAAVEQQGAATAEIARNVAETAAAANTITGRTGDVSAEAARTQEQASGVNRNTMELITAVDDLRRSVVQAVRTSTTDVDRRASERHIVSLPCRILRVNGESQRARVADLSIGGACVSGGPDMRVGERGTLELEGAGCPLPFEVRNADRGLLHIAFHLDEATAEQFRPAVAVLARQQAA